VATKEDRDESCPVSRCCSIDRSVGKYCLRVARVNYHVTLSRFLRRIPFLKVKPTPCWWFTAATLGLVAAATFLFNRFVAPPGAMLISPVGYVVGSAVVLALEYRGRQVVLEQVEMKK